jgi:hypothetical protein
MSWAAKEHNELRIETINATRDLQFSTAYQLRCFSPCLRGGISLRMKVNDR